MEQQLELAGAKTHSNLVAETLINMKGGITPYNSAIAERTKMTKQQAIKEQVPRRLRRRICSGLDWHIAIDDGHVSYVYKLNASNKYSIHSLYKKIQKSIKKQFTPKQS